MKAWTGKPFSYQGKYYQVPELAVNPVPVQRPHPPLWTPTLTAETMARAVNRGITPMVGASFSPLASVKKNFGYLDDAMRAAGRHDMRRCAHPLIIVGDTTEGVRKQVRHAIEWLITDFADMFTLRPGEVYPPRFKFQEQLAAYIRSLTFERVVNEDLMWVGDANYVADRLKWLRDECKVDYILSNMSPGGLEHEIVAKSMELLATKVMPQVG